MFDDRPWGANPGGAEPAAEPGPDVAAEQPQQVRYPLLAARKRCPLIAAVPIERLGQVGRLQLLSAS